MAKAKYANLTMGLKVLANDNNSFMGTNQKGYVLVSLMREYKNNNMNRLPKKAEFEDINAYGIIRNIEKLWEAMVTYNQSVNVSKKGRKNALQQIISLEETICSSLGLNIRMTDNGFEYTETITINQYEFFSNCFAYRTKKGKVSDTQTVSTCFGSADLTNHTDEHVTMDCTTLSTFKKNVLFGLVEAVSNDGSIYDANVQKKCRDNLAKRHTREDKTEKARLEKVSEKVVAKFDEYKAMLDSIGQLETMSEEDIKKGFEKYYQKMA